MCMLTFDYPQTYAVTGSTEEQLAKLRSYIWQLVDMLNQADDGNKVGIGASDTAALRIELEKLRKALRDLEAKSGHGIPSGGTTGQALTKLSDSDYDTGWRTPTGGSGGGVDVSTVLDKVYPVGSIYMSVNSTNPKTLFGGTWVQIKDRFLLAAGTTYKAGATGGEAAHTLTESEMPSHNHAVYYPNAGAADHSAPGNYPDGPSDSTYYAIGSYTSSAGGGTAHNNMPPYLSVYVWKRTA